MRLHRENTAITLLGKEEGVTWYCDGWNGDSQHDGCDVVLNIDLGDGRGRYYNCLSCLNQRIEAFLAELRAEPNQSPKSTALVDGDSITIEGVEFTF